jgi:signal peptidase I
MTSEAGAAGGSPESRAHMMKEPYRKQPEAGTAFRMPAWLQTVLIGRRPRRTIVRIAVLAITCFVVFRLILLPILVRGPSMLPAYPEGGVNFVNRLAYVRSSPQRGDVVGIRLAGVHVMFLKRIVALPGETIEFRAGRVYINGARLEEPYVQFACDWDIPPETVPADAYYVVGDNRAMPEMFHEKGIATRPRLVGKVLLCKNLFVLPPRWR